MLFDIRMYAHMHNNIPGLFCEALPLSHIDLPDEYNFCTAQGTHNARTTINYAITDKLLEAADHYGPVMGFMVMVTRPEIDNCFEVVDHWYLDTRTLREVMA